jgi:hypothetical protein
MPGPLKNLVGIIGNLFQVGLGGPQIKSVGARLLARDSTDTAYAALAVATPVDDLDAANKQYVDTVVTRTVVTGQFDGNSPLPLNTLTESFYVVTTSGPNASIGQLLWDNGLGIGTVTVLVSAARMIVTEQALTGGTVTFRADSVYIWDTAGSAWVNGGGTLMSGARRVIRYTVTNAASQDSAVAIPANARVLLASFLPTTPYSAGATVSVGRAGSTSLIMTTGQNVATVAGTPYVVEQDTDWGAASLAVRTTVSGAPAAGAGVVLVEYCQPDA